VSLHDAWASLRRGGNLLSAQALDALPAANSPNPGLADRLRAVLVDFEPESRTGEVMPRLLDTVLEDACGLETRWRKGHAVTSADGEKLLDGTVFKPRRVFSDVGSDVLAVFTADVERVGVGRGRRPVAQVLEYIRRREIPFGLLTNGREWRLLWADTDNLAWAQWDAERWLDGEALSDELLLLRRVLTFHSLSRGTAEHCPLLAAIRETRRGQAKLSRELGERVRLAVETLLRSRNPVVGPAWSQHLRTDLYVGACHFVMRLVVVLFAEARELLPVDNPIYFHAYALRGLLEQLDRLTPERRRGRSSAWPRLLALFRLLHQGSSHPQVNLPAYGGELFKPGDATGDGLQCAIALLEAIGDPPDDDSIYRMLVLLTRTTERVREGAVWRTVAAPVDFTELTSEYIGILYEGLLDYELHRADAEPVVFLNLGEQPALPLDRLEGMDDKSLVALVEKAKVKSTKSEEAEEEAEGEDADEDPDEEADESAAVTAPLAPEELPPDDPRGQARERALAWARKAALAAKLVKKPRGAKDDLAAKAQLDAIAAQLIAAVKLPGELYLVRWGGTRKGAGTFYTRPQLTLPTVRRTLDPLLRDNDGALLPPEEILARKVCDPAMGSGSFLVAALRVLTESVVTALHIHGRIDQVGGYAKVDCALLPEADRAFPVEGLTERLEAVVRRAVVEHCLYGVDLDPLAVELARVALWVETLDRRLPFTFLDHKLRCGDALVGCWLDRFRDYPLLAFNRQSPDKGWNGVHHTGEPWTRALSARRADAVERQRDLLDAQERLDAAVASDEDLKTAVERMRRLYRDLRAVPAGRPDERARIWRERIQRDPAMEKVREAFDVWCALWFWPLDRLGTLPLPNEFTAPSDEARAEVRALRARWRFFHWEIEFPDVFTAEGAGFDAVVGNPPWEIQKPSSKEFFTDLDPLYRAYGKQEALKVQRELFQKDAAIEARWLDHLRGFRDRGNFVRNTAEPFGDAKVAKHAGEDLPLARGKASDGLHALWRARRMKYRGLSDPKHPFRHQGAADLNTYKMFTEVAHALLRHRGRFGLVVPSGLYTDKGTSELRRLLLEQCSWQWLYGFENKLGIFEIHRSFKFCVCLAEKGSKTKAIQAAFMRHALEDWADARGLQSVTLDAIRALSPSDFAILEFGDPRLATIVIRTAELFRPLGDSNTQWSARYFCDEFHTSKDSKLFPPLPEWSESGFLPIDATHWRDGEGTSALAVIEGRMIAPFRYNAKGWVSGKGREACWRDIPTDQEGAEPQYLIAEGDYITQSNYGHMPGPRLVFKDVTSATNERSAIGTFLARTPCVHTAPFLVVQGDLLATLALTAVFNSAVFDSMLRLRMGGLHLTWNVLSAVLVPQRDQVPVSVTKIAARLCLTSRQFAPEWKSLIDRDKRLPWRRFWAITSHERLRLRCMLDAIIAVLYGLSRDNFGWILKDCDHPTTRLADKTFCRALDPKGFWRVDKTADPELRHTVLSLVAYDDLQHAIAEAGDRDRGIEVFCAANAGDGWMLPESLCLKELRAERTVDADTWDARAEAPQPVASLMGPRFLDWQLAQTPDESWAECERQALAILGESPTMEAEVVSVRSVAAPMTSPAPIASQNMPTADRQLKMFD
jgi:hypothetical protein